jgi:hypothetical protein
LGHKVNNGAGQRLFDVDLTAAGIRQVPVDKINVPLAVPQHCGHARVELLKNNRSTSASIPLACISKPLLAEN